MGDKIKNATLLTHYGEDSLKHNGAIVPPLYQNTLFKFENWDAIDAAYENPYQNCIYTRGNNPTVNIAEEKLAKLAGGEKSKMFASGMAAVTSSIMHFAKINGHIITINNVYGPATSFMGTYLKEKMNIDVTFISGKSIEEFKENIRENTCLIYLESPSSAIFSMQDIKAVADLAKEHGIKTIIDNTWATPIFQKPLEMGIDIEVHSCSKYIGGHSDVISGVAIGKESDIKEIYEKEHSLFGATPSPHDAWLIIRSLRTLELRVKQHEKSAMKVAQFLENHEKVRKVNYPGLKSFDQYELGKKQMTGYTGLLTLELDSEDIVKIKAFLDELKIFSIGVSWGGHESLAYVNAISYLKELTPEQFKAMGISLGMVRLSIGLEDVDDLIEDLNNALKKLY